MARGFGNRGLWTGACGPRKPRHDGRFRGAHRLPKALFTYWFMCFGIALFEGIIIFLGRTPQGQFR
jgi:hypothetical protein